MSISTLFLTIVCTCVEVNSDGHPSIKMSLSGGLTMIIVLLIVINKTVYLFETLTYFIFYPPLTYCEAQARVRQGSQGMAPKAKGLKA